MEDRGAFGFLTVVDSPTHGLFGGYLLVDPLGRPLEFHCTAPVKVSRAQQILYGPTLHAHLHGDRIGAALVAEATVTPVVVLTDVEPMLTVRSRLGQPLALVRPCDPLDQPVDTAGFTIGAARVSPHPGDQGDEAFLRERLAEFGATVDLREPFERIRAAIDEAQRH